MWEARGQLDDLEATRDFAHRVGQHLAVLGREDGRQLLPSLVEELAECEENLLPSGGGKVSPPRKRGLCGRNGGVDLSGVREGNGLGLLPESRVEHRSATSAVALYGPAPDPVLDDGEGDGV